MEKDDMAGGQNGELSDGGIQDMTEQENRLEECLVYLRERPVYRKLLEKFREKYVSLGYFGGKVTLTGLNAAEKAHLGGFLGKDFAEQKSVTVSAAAMEKALADSRFSGITWEELLNRYFGESMVSRKEREKRQEREQRLFFERILKEQTEKPGGRWLEQTLAEHAQGYSFLLQQYREAPEQLEKLLQTVLHSICELPLFQKETGGEPLELLAVFAARTTGNPHYFDEGMPGERLLSAFLRAFLGGNAPGGFSGMTGAERKNRLLYEAGILKDDLSNDTLVYGLSAVGKDGRIHEGIEGFRRNREPVKLTLLTLGRLSEIRGQGGRRVYIVENPAVFSRLMQAYPDSAFVCGNGQPRLATLVLLDMLKENSILYYAGDFDPEGLLIAQRLKERYGERLQLWNYQVSYYETYVSEVRLDEARMKKMDRVVLEELQELKAAMQRKQRAAYQEAMIEEYQILEEMR